MYNQSHRRSLILATTVMGNVAPRAKGADDAANRLAWMALVLTPGLGATRVLRAMSLAAKPADVFSMSLTELEGLAIPAASARFVFEGKARAAAEEEAQRLEEQGAGFLTYGCPEYPERLREIYDPPAVLWYRGDTSILQEPGIAVVGTRHPSVYGSGMAQMLSRELAARGMVILSGMRVVWTRRHIKVRWRHRGRPSQSGERVWM